MGRYLRVLRRRDYALLWGGSTVSALGDGMSFVALLWLALELGGDPNLVGWLAATYTAPVVVGGLVAGIILDRFDKRWILAADNLIRGAAFATVPIASALSVLSTIQLFAVAATYGLLAMTTVAGIPSVIPSLVAEEDRTTANAMESLSYGIAGLAGPVIAGIVIATAGAPAVLAVDAATYLIFAACLMAMRPVARTSSSAIAAREPRGAGIGPAIRFVLGAPAILATALITTALNLGKGIFVVLIPIYARDVLGGGPSTYGALVSAFLGGSLCGLLLVGAVGWHLPLGRSIAAGALATGVVLSLLLVTPSFIPAVLILVVAGMFASSLTTWAQTIWMRLIPGELRGRVFALLRTLILATAPIGSVVGGALLASGNAHLAIAAMAALVSVPGAVGLLLPALGRHATGEVAPAEPATLTSHA